ncbi:hypothetical protein KCP74_21375 [Salmonella enterica subsp. enterica]|nr:hypothetical protein KCP74_21375 [Salmonella enterica subsp. enterica]
MQNGTRQTLSSFPVFYHCAGNCNVFRLEHVFSGGYTGVKHIFTSGFAGHGTENASLGKRLAQHPYDRAVILSAGVKVSATRHVNILFHSIPRLWRFTVWRGLVWGELGCHSRG